METHLEQLLGMILSLNENRKFNRKPKNRKSKI